ncbi:MAG: CPBP family intramembrane metalloprotease [Anaerolineae bacterium]|nr:CPBP family intramembrane metalloprotease [Anaerolineae bacterium]
MKDELLRKLILALAVYAIFCAISATGRLGQWGIALMTMAGLGIPLVWGWRTGRWREIGFVRMTDGRTVIGWGIAAGIATAILGVLVIGTVAPPPDLAVELALGGVLWLLVASPFQEFFFRGWLQTRLENALGAPVGLLLATLLFTLWHYVAPFTGGAFPLETPVGFIATFAAGWAYGYSFQRTGSIVTPWLAHASAGIVFIIIGSMDFTAQFAAM